MTTPKISLMLGACLWAGCIETGVEKTGDDSAAPVGETGEAGDTGETGEATPPGTPAAELGASLTLQSSCFQDAAGTVTLGNAGDGPLTVYAATVDALGDGALQVGPDPAPETVVDPGGALDFEILWTPGDAEQFSATLTVTTDDPDTPEQTSALAGLVLRDGLAPVVSVTAPDCVHLLPADGLELVGAAEDSDSDPDGLYAVWESDVDGVLQEGPLDENTTLSLAPEALSGGDHIISLTVTDDCGLSGSDWTEVSAVEVLASYPGPSPDGLAFDSSGYLWVADWQTNELYQLEPDTLGILRQISLTGSGADGLAWKDGEILVSFYTTNEVQFLDACTGDVNLSWTAPGGGISDVCWDGKTLWTTDYTASTIYAVDPATGSSLASYSAPYGYINGLAWDGAEFWMTANGTSDVVARLDASFAVQETYSHTGSDPRGVAWDGADVWYSDGTEWVIDVLSR